VPIFGEDYTVRAQIEEIDGYSAHADRNEMLDYMRGLQPERLREVFVVHGEESASTSLAQAIKELGAGNVVVPNRGDIFEVN